MLCICSINQSQIYSYQAFKKMSYGSALPLPVIKPKVQFPSHVSIGKF